MTVKLFNKTPRTLALTGWLLLLLMYACSYFFSRIGFELTPVILALSPIGLLALSCWIFGFGKGLVIFKNSGFISEFIVVMLISLPPVIGAFYLLWLIVDGF